MRMYTNRDIADYYNQTLHHYKRWWKLGESLALHYGIWDKSTTNFADALGNTNKIMCQLACVKDGQKIMDAGCGVGGSGVFMAKNFDVKVSGLTLSEKHYHAAIENSQKFGLASSLDFHIGDFCNTSFKDKTFNLVWSIESVVHITDKQLFAKEANRLLMPGGKIIIADYFKTSNAENDVNNYMEKWRNIWNMAPIESLEEYIPKFTENGFTLIENHDYTKGIYKSAKLMFYASILGTIPSVIYNFFFKNVSEFGKNNYKSGYYQFKALKKEFWQYRILVFEKNEN